MIIIKILVNFFTATILLVSATFASIETKSGTCNKDNVSISYTFKEDYSIGCEGVKRAELFFKNWGFSIDSPVNIVFKKNVKVKYFGEEIIVYGYFERSTMTVYMSSLTSPLVSNPDRKNFKIKPHKFPGLSESQRNMMALEFHKSVVAHEVGHLYAQHNFNILNNKKSLHMVMGHGVHEYIAYLVQLTTMDRSLKDMVLSQYKTNDSFDMDSHINALIHGHDPHGFGIKSYHHFSIMSDSAKKNFLERILSNQFNPDSIMEIPL